MGGRGWVPACAGMTNKGAGMTMGGVAMGGAGMGSRLRGNDDKGANDDEGAGMATGGGDDDGGRGWVPACAGMTIGGRE